MRRRNDEGGWELSGQKSAGSQVLEMGFWKLPELWEGGMEFVPQDVRVASTNHPPTSLSASTKTLTGG